MRASDRHRKLGRRQHVMGEDYRRKEVARLTQWAKANVAALAFRNDDDVQDMVRDAVVSLRGLRGLVNLACGLPAIIAGMLIQIGEVELPSTAPFNNPLVIPIGLMLVGIAFNYWILERIVRHRIMKASNTIQGLSP